MYKDNSPDLVIQKASQIGISELMICDLFTLTRLGLRGMYVLDSDQRRATFVADRIDKLADYSPEYRRAIASAKRETDSRVLKTIYGRAVKFVGSRSRANFYEFACDVLWIDEFDLHDPDILVYARDRIQDSKRRHTRKFGNPTLDRRGIAKEYAASDMKEWHVACGSCGFEQALDWKDHFVVQTETGAWKLRDELGRPICKSCGLPFNRLGPGRWVALKPDSPVSGYKVSRLFVKKSAADIAELFAMFLDALGSQSKMQNFVNNYLAETYENTDDKLTEAVLEKAASKGVPSGAVVKPRKKDAPPLRRIAGIDQGALYHYRISEVYDGVRYPTRIGVARSLKEVVPILRELNVTTLVIDAQGGSYAETRDFAKAYAGAWICYYIPKDRVAEDYRLDYDDGIVYTNRTEILDLSTRAFRDGTCILPSDWASVLDGQLKEQLLIPSRILDATGRPVWTKGNDHLFHAHAYEYLALRISGMRNSEPIQKDWSV